MIRYVTLFFAYCFSIKLTSSPEWFREFTRKFTNKKAKRKQHNAINQTNNNNDNETTNESDQKKEKLKNILALLEDEEAIPNELKLAKIGQCNTYNDHKQLYTNNIKQLWPGAGVCFLVIFATATITIKPFSSTDIYIWNYLSFLFLFIVWNNLKTCTQVPIYILIFIAREKLCRLFPFRCSSRLMGEVCDVTIPRKLRKYIYSAYIKMYGVKIEEATVQDLEYYTSLNSFFRRSIQLRFRPISPTADIVSPCDGTVVYHGKVQDGIVRQVKGMCFSLKEFLGENYYENLQRNIINTEFDTDMEYGNKLMQDPHNNQLNCCVIYLAPGDYHRFHSPAQCNVQHRRHVTGELISVNPKLLSWLPHLFAINERVVLNGKYQHGFISITAVGATNVGSIQVYNDPKLKTNLWDTTGKCNDLKYDDELVLKKGDPLGEFRFGSTLVIIYETPKRKTKKLLQVGQTVQLGQAMSCTT